MNKFDYVIATRADQEAVVDFGNYVFSQAHAPHDFKTLLPKVYADHVNTCEVCWHFLAKREDGCIRGMVANNPIDLRVLDTTLHVGCVGTVSTHPYARGEGHMKRLMKDMIDHARTRGMDLLILGGQRQRYNYYGFEQAGVQLLYTVTTTNLRHLLADVDISGFTFADLSEDMTEEFGFAMNLVASKPVIGVRPRELFIDIMHSWHSRCRVIRLDGRLIGTIAGGEILLTDEALLPAVLKAVITADKSEKMTLSVALHETERIAQLTNLAEECEIQTVEMISVLNWLPVLSACLKLKASYSRLQDGCATLNIEGTSYTLRVKNGEASVAVEDREPDLTLDHMEAQRLLFGLGNLVCNHPLLKDWLPLPFYISSIDCF